MPFRTVPGSHSARLRMNRALRDSQTWQSFPFRSIEVICKQKRENTIGRLDFTLTVSLLSREAATRSIFQRVEGNEVSQGGYTGVQLNVCFFTIRFCHDDGAILIFEAVPAFG